MFLNERLTGNFHFARENPAPVLRYPDKIIGNLIVRPPGFSWWRGIEYAARISAMERVRIVSLKNIRKRQVAMIRAGQREAARVRTLCRDRHLAARLRTRQMAESGCPAKSDHKAGLPCTPSPCQWWCTLSWRTGIRRNNYGAKAGRKSVTRIRTRRSIHSCGRPRQCAWKIGGSSCLWVGAAHLLFYRNPVGLLKNMPARSSGTVYTMNCMSA